MANANYGINFGITAKDDASSKFQKLAKNYNTILKKATEYLKKLDELKKAREGILETPLSEFEGNKRKPQGLDLRTKPGLEWKGLSPKDKKDLELNKNQADISTYEKRVEMLASLIPEYKKAVEKAQQEMIDDARRKYQEMSNIVKNAFSKMINFAKKYLALIKKFSQPLTNFVKKFGKQADVAKRVEKAFTSISHVFRYMVLRMAFRQALKNFGIFFGKLLQFSEETAVKFNELYNALIKLQVTVVASVAPIIKAFSSMFAGIVNIITRLVTILNQLTSALFNNSKTYIRAKDTALDYRDALEDAGGAANKVLAPFDKINQLGSAKGGSGKSGLEGLNPGDIFEEAEIEKPIESFADRLRKAFEDKTFFDNFNLEGFGHNLMVKLEDTLKQISAIDVGNFIGSLGNAITNLMFGFVDEWHPELWADFIIEVLDNACKKFDFNKLQEFYKTLFGKLADFLKRINDSLVKSNVGSNAAKWVNGILPKMSDLAYELGRFIGEAISQAADFVLGLDTQGIVDVITNFVKGATENGKLTKLVEALFKLLYAAMLALAESAGTMISGNPGATGALIGIMTVWIGASIGSKIATQALETAIISWMTGVSPTAISSSLGTKFYSLINDSILKDSGLSLGQWMGNMIVAGIATFILYNAASLIGKSLKDSLGYHLYDLDAYVGGMNVNMSDEARSSLPRTVQDELNNYKYTLNFDDGKFTVIWDDSGNGIFYNNGVEIGRSIDGGITDEIKQYFGNSENINQVLGHMSEVEGVKKQAEDEGNKIGNFFVDGFKATKAGFENAGIQNVTGFYNKMQYTLASLTPAGLFSKFVIDPVKKIFDIHSPSKVFEEIGGFVISGFNNGLNNKKTDISMFDKFTEDSKESLNSFQTFYTTFAGNIISLTEQLANSIASGINSVGNSMVRLMSIAVDSMREAVAEYNAAASAVGESPIYYNAIKPTWTSLKTDNKLNIPKLATGAVLPANKPFLSVVGDQKHGTNVEAPLDTIKQALREVQGEGNTSRPTNLTIECDKRVLGKLFVDLGNEESRRVGSKFVTI